MFLPPCPPTADTTPPPVSAKHPVLPDPFLKPSKEGMSLSWTQPVLFHHHPPCHPKESEGTGFVLPPSVACEIA